MKKTVNSKLVEDVTKFNNININEETLDYIVRRPITNYNIEEIEVGSVRRYYQGKVIPLYKTDPYRFITDKSKSSFDYYEEYCKSNNGDNHNRSVTAFQKLIVEMKENDYDSKNGIIVVDQFDFIIDGQHRCCIILNQYGEKYRIKVLRVKFSDYGIKPYILNALYNIKKLLRIEC